jgi:hypothetical protein
MLKERTFQIVLVGPGNGVGVEPAQNPSSVIKYDGNRQVVEF